MQVKLAHKVVIAIAIPALFQVGFFWFQLNSVRSLDELESKERSATKLLLLRNQLNVGFSKQLLFFGLLRATGNPEFRTKFLESQREKAQALQGLYAQWKNDKVKSFMVKSAWSQQMLMDQAAGANLGERGQTAAELLGGEFHLPVVAQGLFRGQINDLNVVFNEFEREQKHLKIESQEKENELKRNLLFGLFASILISLASGLLFNRSIVERIQKVVSNIRALEKHENPPELVGGTDEIAVLNQAILETHEKIREAEEFQAQTAQVVAQELNNPIEKLSISIQTLQNDGFKELNSNGAERLKRTLAEINRLRTLVQDLLSLDKISRAGWNMHMETVDLAEIARAAVDTTQDFARSVKIELICDAEETVVVGDPARLQQIVLNLITNAIKFSPPKTKIEVKTCLENSVGKLSVKDHGTGIPEEFQRNIFGKFEQADRTDATEKGGSGLGLAISKKLVESQHGKMGFESKLGRGSTFWLTLPTLQSSSAGAIESPDPPVAVAPAPVVAPAPAAYDKTLWLKRLLVIALPITVQVLTIGALWLVIGSIRQNVNEFDRVSQVASCHSRLMNSVARGTLFSILYNASKTEKVHKAAFLEQKIANDLLAQIKATSGGMPDPTTQAIASATAEVFRLQNEFMDAPQNTTIGRWFGPTSSSTTEEKFNRLIRPLQEAIHREEKFIEGNVFAKVEMRNQVELVGLVSIISMFLVSATLGVFMASRLTSRVKHILLNTERLIAKEPLSAPLAGNDEVAYVDRLFFNAAQQLIQLEFFKQELIAITSHEFRTPLTSVLAKADLIEAGVFGELSDNGQNIVIQLKKNIVDLISLLTNLLDVEKIQSGKILVLKQPTNLSIILNQARQNIQTEVQSRNVNLQISDVQFEFQADAARLTQALTSVLIEIVEYTFANSIINIESEVTPGELTLSIHAPRECVGKSLNPATARGRLARDLLRLIVQQHRGKAVFETTNESLTIQILLPL